MTISYTRPTEYLCDATKRDGEPCGNYALRGGTGRCRFHTSASAKEAAATRVRESDLMAAARKVMPDVAPMMDPAAALRDSAGIKSALAQGVLSVISSLEDPQAVADATRTLVGLLAQIDNSATAIIQHVPEAEEPDDDRTPLEIIGEFMDELDARRDATYLPCPGCRGEGYLPRFALGSSTTVPGAVVPTSPAESAPPSPSPDVEPVETDELRLEDLI